VPIIERKPAAAFRRFHKHIAWLIGATLPVPQHMRLAWASKGDNALATLEFVRGDGIGTAVPLATRFGRLYLTLLQILEVEREVTRYRLKTKEYSYRLLDQSDPRADAILRWEYQSDVAGHGFCRHHVQVRTGVGLVGEVLDLNRCHMPSGWVTIEELIRFLIHDLEVQPLTKEWPAILAESERKFYEEFTGKRYRAARLRLMS
jgi:hypothetical protein